jgi:AcrR family transcriptional regulator
MARRKSGSALSQDLIVEAGITAIKGTSLTDWTVDSVASGAGCAKGLVLYHFRSKDALLLRIADRVRHNQVRQRLEAIKGGMKGTASLDRLWTALVADVRGGGFGLWVGLLADPRTRKAAARTAEDDSEVLAASAAALGVAAGSLALPLIPPALDGYALELLQGHAPADVRERFDSFWLGVLSESEGSLPDL